MKELRGDTIFGREVLTRGKNGLEGEGGLLLLLEVVAEEGKRSLGGGGEWRMVVQWFGTATNWMEKEVIVVG